MRPLSAIFGGMSIPQKPAPAKSPIVSSESLPFSSKSVLVSRRRRTTSSDFCMAASHGAVGVNGGGWNRSSGT